MLYIVASIILIGATTGPPVFAALTLVCWGVAVTIARHGRPR